MQNASEWAGTDWTFAAPLGALKLQGTGTDSFFESNPFTVSASTKYKIVMNIVALGNDGSIRPRLGNQFGDTFTTSGLKTFYITTSNTDQLEIQGNDASVSGPLLINSMSVKEVLTEVQDGENINITPGSKGSGDSGAGASDGIITLGDGGTTNYIDISSTGDTVFVGSAGLPFAEIYARDNTTTTSTSTRNF